MGWRGLVIQPPRPRDSGFRSYPPETIDRLRFIRLAQDLGFSLKEIDELLSLQANPATDCADVRARAQAKLTEVDRKIAHLNEIQFALQNLIDACPGAGLAVRRCSIMDGLEGKVERTDMSTEINNSRK